MFVPFTAGINGIVNVTALTPKRQREIKARISAEAVSVCFFKTDKSDFLCGLNDRGWMASFDWILKPENFAMIIEGMFDNKVSNHKHLQGVMNNLTKQMRCNKGNGDILDSEETAKMLMVMASVYPNFKVDEAGFINTTWHALLKELDYKHASEVLFKLLKVMKFPPPPADIIEKLKIEKLSYLMII